VEKKFSIVAGKWLRGNLSRAREKRKRPHWIRNNVWEQLLVIWNDENYKKYCEKNRKSRLDSQGTSLVYRGGSIPMKAHKKRMVSFLISVIQTLSL